MIIPAEFIEKVHRIFGEAGRDWLPRLPEIAVLCRVRWDLPEGEPCAFMSMNYIEFAATAAGEPVAMKIGVPHAELFTEMEALRLYAGHSAVRLIDAYREQGAMLLQRAMPGTPLWQLEDDRERTRIAAAVMRRLSAPASQAGTLPTFAQWVERAFHLTRTEWDPAERMPRVLLDRAEEAFRTLVRDSPGDVVLHGDLHHENILFDDQAGWLAIDPKGVIGPPCLEVGRYLQNRLPDDAPIALRASIVRERIDVFQAELGYPREWLIMSGLVDCVLSHCWGFEDEGIWEGWYQGVALAHELCQMLDE